MSEQVFGVSACATHHVGADGLPIYGNRFDAVLKFHPPGLAAAKQAGKAWHILSDGTPAYTRRFNQTFGFYEGFAAVEDASGWHHISVAGEDVHTLRHSWCGNFQQGRCAVRSKDGSYFHISTYPPMARLFIKIVGATQATIAMDSRLFKLPMDVPLMLTVTVHYFIQNGSMTSMSFTKDSLVPGTVMGGCTLI